MLFLVIWLVGDVFSIIGLILSKLLNLQLVLALYYTVVDALLIAQSTRPQFNQVLMVYSSLLLSSNESSVRRRGRGDSNINSGR